MYICNTIKKQLVIILTNSVNSHNSFWIESLGSGQEDKEAYT